MGSRDSNSEEERGRSTRTVKDWAQRDRSYSRSRSPLYKNSDYRGRSQSPDYYKDRSFRRPRSPSPIDDEGSRSKYPKESYNSGSRYDDYDRGRDRSPVRSKSRRSYTNESNPGQFVSNYDFDNPVNNRVPEPAVQLPLEFTHELPKLVDPLKIMDLVSIDYYADYLRFNEPNERHSDHNIKRRYDEYKEKYSKIQLKIFFEEHQMEPWFFEKYHPISIKKEFDDIKEMRLKAYHQFCEDLKEGKFDDVCFDVPKAVRPDIATELENRKEDGENKKEEKEEKEEKGNNKEDTIENENENENENNEDKIEEESEKEPELEELPALFIKSIPTSISKAQLLEVCRKAPGFLHLMIGDPNPTKRFHRLGWVFFEKNTDLNTALSLLDKTSVDEFTFHFGIHTQKPSFKIANEISNTARRINIDSLQAQKLAKAYETYFGKEFDCDQMLQDQLITIFHKKRTENRGEPNDDLYETKKTLDFYILYLRKVYCFCYYCCVESETYAELQRKCKDNHLRAQPRMTSNRGGEIWTENLDSKIERKLIGDDDIEIEKIGGISTKKLSEEIIEKKKLVEEINGNKFRCGVCSKLFKGKDYVVKHIQSKHHELYEEDIKQAHYFNNYVKDCNRIVPLPANQTNNNNNLFPNNHGIYPVINNNQVGVYPIPLPLTLQNPNVVAPNPTFASNQAPTDPRQIRSYVDLDAPDDFNF